MAQQVFGPAAVVSVLNRAFTNTSPSNAVFANQVATAGTTDASQLAFAKAFGASFAAGKTAADLSALLMANMGLDNAVLAAALTDYIAANGTQNVGIIAWQLSSILSNLENDGTFGAAAKAWNAEVTAAYEYSSDAKNTTPSSGGTSGNEAAKSLVLTVGQDVLTGSAFADFFRGVAGQPVGNQEQSTFNSSDIIDGGAGVDALILNLVGGYTGGARVKNIETLTLGNNFGAIAFDFNVNQGSNEITDVATIEYDQINVGERLTVNNIVKTAGAGAAEIATLLWDNEAGSVAGQVAANFRASAVTGATNLNVALDDVMALNTNAGTGQLDIGRGVETLTITSQGASANTLNASNNVDGNAADLTSEVLGGNGTNDDSTLTKVVVKGAQAFGRAAAVNTNDALGELNFGLTNRAVGNDLGNSNALASASNLISVAATVTEIDATEADGGVAMRFVSRIDGAGVNVTFKGGKAADYVEFERGNINATGGEGNDTFAFIDNALTSFDFGSADSITGGAGVDTIQLGVNGRGAVVANTTEFNNKTGIDVLDLRAQTNTVTLADAFVAGADAGLVVRSDRIVQSAASTANTTPSLAGNNNGLENAAVTTVVLTELAENRAVEFIGGTGSDRVVVDNASANQFTKLDGGSNVGTAATGAAGSTDSLTVVNTAVLDANDVANIKGFELVNLVESTVGNSSFGLTLSEAFVLANSTAAVPLTIASVTNTYGVRLGAGDVVNLEVSDLLTAAGAVKATIAARAATNVQDLIAAGVTVNFQVNGVTQSTNAAPAALAGVFNLATAPAAATLDDVTGAAIVPVVTAELSGTAGVDALTITGAANDFVTALAGNDTITLTGGVNLVAASTVDGGDGTDTLIVSGGSTLNAGTITGVEILDLTGNTSMTVEQNNAFTFVNGTGVNTVTITNGGTITAAPLVESYTLSSAGNAITLTAGQTGAITGDAAVVNDTVTATVAVLNGMGGGGGVLLGNGTGDSLNITGGMTATLSLAANGLASGGSVTGVEIVNISGASTANALTTGNVGTTTINASGVTGGGIALVTTGLTTLTSLTLSAGNDTVTNLRTAANATVAFGGGNDNVTDLAAKAGALTLQFATAAAGSTNTIAFAGTTANFAVGDIFDFATNVTSIKTGGANVANQAVITSGVNTSVLFDINGDGAHSAGETLITIVGNNLTFGLDNFNLVVATSA